jgi:hypothetical protein
MTTNETDIQCLIRDHIQVSEAISSLRDTLGHLDMEITRWMEAEGASAIPHDTHLVSFTPGKPTYRYDILAGLREILPPEVIEKAWMPEHEETVTVPEKWDIRVVNGFTKYGTEVQAIIGRARLDGPLRLKIAQKKEPTK